MFLATTAIDSFWDKNEKILFLGPWCLLPQDKHIWKLLDYEIMPSPWRDRDAYYKAGKYTYRTYHYLLAQLTGYLNSVHNTNHTERFWQIIIGPWLLHFIEALYDKYWCLRKALRQERKLRTTLLDDKCFMTPIDTLEFFDLSLGDFYNLQMYSQLLSCLGVKGKTKAFELEKRTVLRKGKSFKDVIKKLVFILSCKIAGRSRIILWDVYLSNHQLFQYVLASSFSAFPILYSDDGQMNCHNSCSDHRRNGLSALDSCDEFTRMLVSILPSNFPILYLEGFKGFSGGLSVKRKSPPKVIVSATGWTFNETLKFCAADWCQNGTILCGVQHGGLYGTAKWMPVEKHEIEITDNFYSWGWRSKDNKAVKPLANPKVGWSRYKRKGKKRKSHILFVGNSNRRYLYRFTSWPVAEMFEEYMQWRNLFLQELSPEVRANVLVRLHAEDYGRGEREAILKVMKEVAFDDHSASFLSRLDNAEIVVSDHPITCIFESTSKNVPTVMFWNPEHWELRKDAKEFFEGLFDVGIWHKGPEEAGKFLNKIIKDPLKWWMDAKTQEAKDRFLHRYAMGSNRWAKMWWREMKALIA